MATINVGGTQLSTDGETLIITRPDQPNFKITLDERSVDQLLNFVSLNRRRSFRVPLTNSSGLAVRLETDAARISVSPLDISLHGIRVRCPDDESSLPSESAVEVQLEFEGNIQNLKAIVRRQEGREYGLSFGESIEGENPQAELSALVMELQRQWLARRTVR